MRTRDRKEDIRKIRQTFIIYCSGKTEVNYFNGLRNFLRDKTNLKIETRLIDVNAENLVNKVINFKYNNKGKFDRNDKFYIIIDRDPGNNTEQQIINAYKKATSNNIKIIISNISIEVRFLMHFMVYTQSGQTVEKYIKKLTILLKSKYFKNDELIYEKLKERTIVAIKNAKSAEKNIGIMENVSRIAKKYEKIDSDIKFCFYEPYTSVYKLVEKLIK